MPELLSRRASFFRPWIFRAFRAFFTIPRCALSPQWSASCPVGSDPASISAQPSWGCIICRKSGVPFQSNTRIFDFTYSLIVIRPMMQYYSAPITAHFGQCTYTISLTFFCLTFISLTHFSATVSPYFPPCFSIPYINFHCSFPVFDFKVSPTNAALIIPSQCLQFPIQHRVEGIELEWIISGRCFIA